jgi:hypothetical protein
MEELKPGNWPQEVTFDPANETAFGTRTISFRGEEVLIHDINNMPYVFDSFLRRQSGEQPRNPLELQYFAAVGEIEMLPGIICRFAESNPDLFRELTDISYLRDEEYKARQRIRSRKDLGLTPNPEDIRLSLPDEEENSRRKCFYSMAFDELATIAKQIDPDFDTEFFVR